MRHSGSVLVVVLGLLAILAVVGVAFVTMSTLDRTTSASFALQTQMMLSADGAIEYTIHEMVLDVWEWDVANRIFSFTGKLLTGRAAYQTDANSYGGACEPYDFPSAAADAWLSSPITSQKTPTWMSFQEPTTRVFGGLRARGTAKTKPGNWPDNLGLPVADSDLVPTASNAWTNGIWVPDLVAPFNQYLVRTSVTVLDHNALVNLNAHGNQDTGGMWPYDDCRGDGYFVSDVDPKQLQQGFNPTVLNKLLVGAGTVPGCWGVDKSPGNAKAGAILCENPSDGADVPFTLDEEFELRRLWGTHFKSRLEWFWLTLDTTPDNYPNASLDNACLSRLKTTTVSWTAEVRGDSPDPSSKHATASALGSAWTDQAWSCPKPDLNTSSVKAIYEALRDSNAWADGVELKQVAANIITFRRKGVANFTAVSVGDPAKDFYGAQRQPFFTEATCSAPVINSSDPADIKRTYSVKIEVYNPWPGDYDGASAGLNTAGLNVKIQGTASLTPPPAPESLPPTMGVECFVANFTVVCTNDKTLKDAVQDIRLYKGDLILDKISGTDLQTLNGGDSGGHMSRSVFRKSEKRGSRNNSDILVLYVGDWQTDDSETPNTVRSQPSLANSAVPIRFPNCVPEDKLGWGLPVRAPTGSKFKAFARVGDLNQVLRFTPGGDPWIVTVSRTPRSAEANVKFDWMKDIGNLSASGTAAAYAANVLSAGGPWVDELDNDGDGKTDAADKGLSNATEAGAPEFRVAGMINLNTATDETLDALGSGTGTGAAGLRNKVIALRGTPGSPTPIKSPAQILQVLTGSGAGVEGRDEPFTRISNIATVRSDTFSIYGTVQVVDPASQPSPRTGNIPDSGIVRSRRFWALVDRSPALAFPPTDSKFIRPRILNFQWLD